MPQPESTSAGSPNHPGHAAVLIDGTSLGRRMKGVGRYAWHICAALDRELPEEVRIKIVVFDNDPADFPARFRGEWITIPYQSELVLGLATIPRLLREHGASVLVRPADKIGKCYGVPTLTVCHDLNPMIWAVQTPRRLRRRLMDTCWEYFRGRAMRHSARVVCNSRFVREAVAGHFGLKWEKTCVGYCGVDRRLPELAAGVDRAKVLERFGNRGFVLAFATGDSREGAEILPELWAAAKSGGYPGALVVAGVNNAAGYAGHLWGEFESRGVGGSVIFLPFLGESEIELLAGLYSVADFYLETSRHEGFGMQLIEAMACATTCFSSGRGALREVGGGFPLPFEIDDPSGAGKAIAEAWSQGAHQRDNAAQVAYAMGFDWSVAGAEVVGFVRQALRNTQEGRSGSF